MVKLYSEKRADLEEQQLHLNVGLGKIAETVEQVEEMQKSLAVKSQVYKTFTYFDQLYSCSRNAFCKKNAVIIRYSLWQNLIKLSIVESLYLSIPFSLECILF